MLSYAITSVAMSPRNRTHGAMTNTHSHQYRRWKNGLSRRGTYRMRPLGRGGRFVGGRPDFGAVWRGRYHSAPGGCPGGVGVTSGPARPLPDPRRPVLATGPQMLRLARASRDEGLTEMIPRATHADLDHVAAGAAVICRHGECLVELPYTSVIRLEVVRVNVGEELQLIFVTHRARPGALLPDVAGRPEQLRMRVADVEPRDDAAA